MQRIFSVLFGVVALVMAAGCAGTHQKAAQLPPLVATNQWTGELRRFEAQDATNPPPRRPIVFTGSSSIRMWTNLTADFPNMGVMNRGFGGSQMSDVNQHFERLILQYHPRQVVIYCGGNDINAGKSAQQVVAETQKFLDRMARDLPKTKVSYISIALNPSRWNQRDKVTAANQRIKELIAARKNAEFIDVVSAMLEADGTPKPDIFLNDRLHMNRKGYELWKPIVGARLVK
jgi:lysophospholipase L1-like esterase